MGSLIIIVALFAVLWLLIIRPQRAKQRKQQSLLSAIEPGDEILTVGGIYGIVQELEADEDGGDLVVEIAEGIHVRVARRAVAAVVKPEEEDEADEADEAPGDAEPDEPAAAAETAPATPGVAESAGVDDGKGEGYS